MGQMCKKPSQLHQWSAATPAKAQNSPLCLACHPSASGLMELWEVIPSGWLLIFAVYMMKHCAPLGPGSVWGVWKVLLSGVQLWALLSSLCSIQGIQFCRSFWEMNPPWAGGTSNISEGRGATHQPPNACTALRQDKGLYLTHLSSGQMSKKSLLSFLWLNHQYTKTPSFSQECWKSCS